MILRELAKVFTLSLVGITGILVMAGVIAEAQQQGLSPSQILMAIPLLIPSTLPYTIPATTLFATCVVYGRLSADNEILAIRAAGVHLVRVVWPGALLGLLMSGATMGLYYSIIPTTTHLLRSRVLNDVEEYLYTILRKDKCIKQPRPGWAMWGRRVQGKHITEARFKPQNSEGRYDPVARARTAELRVFLPQRKILVKMNQCDVTNDEGTSHGYFESQTFEVDLPKELADTKKIRARAMTWPELFARRLELRGEEQAILDEIADVEA